jgi:hypothetical protein
MVIRKVLSGSRLRAGLHVRLAMALHVTGYSSRYSLTGDESHVASSLLYGDEEDSKYWEKQAERTRQGVEGGRRCAGLHARDCSLLNRHAPLRVLKCVVIVKVSREKCTSVGSRGARDR